MAQLSGATNSLKALIQLCVRRGFVFPTSSLYSPHNHIKGQYDYGPLGTELKNNLRQQWWKDLVHKRRDIVGLDASILTHSKILQTSGHVDGFSDDLADCLLGKDRFRTDHASPLKLVPHRHEKGGWAIPIQAPNKALAKEWFTDISTRLAPQAKVERKGSLIYLFPIKIDLPANAAEVLIDPTNPLPSDSFISKNSSSSNGCIWIAQDGPSESLGIPIPFQGFTHPTSNSIFLTEGRPFNLLFKTFVDPIDPIQEVIKTTVHHHQKGESMLEIRQKVDSCLQGSVAYLRPETAQGVYTNFMSTHKALNLHPPFGIAQVGKSFRNELRREQFLYRSAEFEQMELQFFVHPEDQDYFHEMWKEKRLSWWQGLANHPEDFRLREHSSDELAHYARGCADIEYKFPWGWGELEGVANRGNYDLSKHAKAAGVDMAVECNKRDSNQKDKVVPCVIESAAGLDRGVMALLLDAFRGMDDPTTSRPNLRLHPRLSPYKAAILPLMPKPELLKVCYHLQDILLERGIPSKLEDQNLKIGKRYYRHDEIGTPWCLTVDFESLEDQCVTLRNRDSAQQQRIQMTDVVNILSKSL